MIGSRMNRKFKKALVYCVVMGGGIGASNTYSAEWTVAKSISLNEVYTDNTDLSHENTKSELITTVSPNLSLQGRGAKANLNLNAALEVNSAGGADSINPRLGANASVELIDDFFYIDASADIIQNTVDAFLPSGSDRLSNTSNTTNTYNYKTSPYFAHRFKGFAELVGRYTYNYQFNGGSNASLITSQNFSLDISSGTDFSRITWGAAFNYRDSGSDESSSELLSTDVSLGYRFNRSWRLTSSLGVESNDFEATRENNDGSRWNMSAIWTPSSRTSLNIGYGDRFFGSVPTLDFSHRSRKSLIKASYSRELTDSASLLSRQDAFQATDVFGNPVDPIIGDPLPLTNSTINITDGLFVNEAFELSYTLTGKRSSVAVGASHSVQKYESGRVSETLEKYNVSLQRSLSSLLEANVGYSVSQQRREGTEDAVTSDYSLGVTRKVSKDSNLRFTYRFIDRESQDLSNDYQENRLQLSFTTSL